VTAHKRDQNGALWLSDFASLAMPLTRRRFLGSAITGLSSPRGRSIDCKHFHDAPAGETVCVPFPVTNKGHGASSSDAAVWPLRISADQRVFGRVYVGTDGRGVLYGEPRP
jgi:hypothetical protein